MCICGYAGLSAYTFIDIKPQNCVILWEHMYKTVHSLKVRKNTYKIRTVVTSEERVGAKMSSFLTRRKVIKINYADPQSKYHWPINL